METSRTPVQSIVSAGAGLFILVLLLGCTGLFAITFTSMTYERLISRHEELSNTEATLRTAQVAFKRQVQEWKNILLRGQDQANFEKYQAAFQQDSQQVRQLLGQAATSLRASQSAVPLQAVEKALAMHQELDQIYADGLKLYRPGDPASIFTTDASVRGRDRPTDEQIDLAAEAADEASRVGIQAAAVEARERYAVMYWINVTMMLTVLVVVGVLIYRAVKGEQGRRSAA